MVDLTTVVIGGCFEFTTIEVEISKFLLKILLRYKGSPALVLDSECAQWSWFS